MEKLARDIRKSVEGRERFRDCDRQDSDRAADILFEAGYYRIEALRRMQVRASAFFISNLRRHHSKTNSIKRTRLSLGMIETFQAEMKNAKDPRIEELQIPREIAKWAPSFADFSGILVPDQEMVIRPTIELARGRQELPAYTPFGAAELSAQPWMPSDPAAARPHEKWKKTQASHRRANDQSMSFQLFALNYLRFVLAGGLDGAWTLSAACPPN